MMLPSATRCERNAESMHAAGGMERERRRKLLLRRVKSVNQHPQSEEERERGGERRMVVVTWPNKQTNQLTDEQEAPNSDRRFIPGMCFKTFCWAPPYQTLDEGHRATPTVSSANPYPVRAVQNNSQGIRCFLVQSSNSPLDFLKFCDFCPPKTKISKTIAQFRFYS